MALNRSVRCRHCGWLYATRTARSLRWYRLSHDCGSPDNRGLSARSSSEAGAGARSARRSLSRERSSGRSASPGCSSSSKSICGASANRASTRRARADPFAGNQTPATDSRRLIPSCRLVRSCVGWGPAICGRCEAAPLRSGFRPPVPRPGRERQLRYLEPIVGPDPSRSAGDVSLPASCAARSHRRKDPVPTPSGGRESGALRPTSPAQRWPAARR
jgi:hypothetical protein